jgi:hypothetical protein
MIMQDAHLVIPELLRDASLLQGSWDRTAGALSLQFECLLRSTDGSVLHDRIVALHLRGVSAIGIAYYPKWPEMRPSALPLLAAGPPTSLVPWPLAVQEVALRLDSRTHEERIGASTCITWVWGSLTEGRSAPTRVSFEFAVEGDSAIGVLWIGCDALVPWAHGRPLDLAVWTAQCDAWWRVWAERSRQEMGTRAPEGVSSELAVEHAAADIEASPEPPFDVATTGFPDELVPPIRVWFEAPRNGAWLDLARAFPDLDSSELARAEVLERAFTDEEPQRFAREARDVWIEGQTAHVRVVGVAFFPEGDEPASARLSAWSFELRKRSGRWQILRDVEEDAPPDVRQAVWVREWPPGPVRAALGRELAELSARGLK